MDTARNDQYLARLTAIATYAGTGGAHTDLLVEEIRPVMPRLARELPSSDMRTFFEALLSVGDAAMIDDIAPSLTGSCASEARREVGSASFLAWRDLWEEQADTDMDRAAWALEALARLGFLDHVSSRTWTSTICRMIRNDAVRGAACLEAALRLRPLQPLELYAVLSRPVLCVQAGPATGTALAGLFHRARRDLDPDHLDTLTTQVARDAVANANGEALLALHLADLLPADPAVLQAAAPASNAPKAFRRLLAALVTAHGRLRLRRSLPPLEIVLSQPATHFGATLADWLDRAPPGAARAAAAPQPAG